MGLQGPHRRTGRGLTRRDPRWPVFPDRGPRVFAADAPNRLWVADLTQHRTGEGWLYLAAVVDAFSRRVVRWAMAERTTAKLVIDALNMAVWNRRPNGELVHHSDHGAQYTFLAFSRRMETARVLGPWARWATPWTMRWQRASLPCCIRRCSTTDPGPPVRR